MARCKELAIPISDSVNVVNILADQYEIREWNASGLPRDSVSVKEVQTSAGNVPGRTLHTCVCICTYIRMYKYIYNCMYIHTYVCMYIYVHVCVLRMHPLPFLPGVHRECCAGDQGKTLATDD